MSKRKTGKINGMNYDFIKKYSGFSGKYFGYLLLYFIITNFLIFLSKFHFK